MSKLLVSPELLIGQLFEGVCPEVRIAGASFDTERSVVILEVEGPGVPAAQEIVAVCRRQPALVVEFKPR